MVDKQTIGISSLIALGLILASTIGPTFFQSQKYYCEARPSLGVVHCDSFSKYVAVNGKCIRDDNTNIICREGWTEVINDQELPEEQPQEDTPQEQPSTPPDHIAGSRVWQCSQSGCIEI